jgi:hypothetical protein
MSLVVSSFWRDPVSGELEEHTDWSDGHHMAGAEVTRWELWGSAAVRRRAASFLPQLAEADLWVGANDLDVFEAEVRRLAADLDGLEAETGRRRDLLAHYLDNFLRAIEHARASGGGVNIT